MSAISSKIDEILSKDNFTLEELLEDEEIIIETKNQNKALIDFLSKPEVTRKMLNYVLNKAKEDDDERTKILYPAISYEILISESPEIEHNFFENNYELLDEAFNFFKSSKIDHHHARFVFSIIETLLVGNPNRILDYMSSKSDLLGTLADHFSSFSVVDFLVKISNIDSYNAEFKELFIKQNFVPIVVEKLSPSNSLNHSNIAYGFIDFLTKCGNIAEELINEFQKEEVLLKLFSYMFENQSSLIYGSNVIIFLIQYLSQSSAIYDKLPSLIEIFLKYLPKFADLLLKAPEKTHIDLPSGKTNIVGPVRIKIVELIVCIISVNISQIDEKILESNILQNLINLFFEYENNSILHKNITFIFSNIIENDKLSLMKQMFKDFKLHTKIIDYLYKRNEKEENGESRNSCTAYILELAQLISKKMADNDDLDELLGSEYLNDDIFDKMSILENEDSNDDKSVSYNSDSGSDESSDLEENLDDLDMDDNEDFPYESEINEYRNTDAEVLVSRKDILSIFG